MENNLTPAHHSTLPDRDWDFSSSSKHFGCLDTCPELSLTSGLDSNAEIVFIKKHSCALIAALQHQPAPDLSPIRWQAKLRLINGKLIPICILVDS